MKRNKTYDVRYELDEAGYWFASIPAIAGCFTQGRTIERARERIREALSLFDKNAANATLIDDVKLPKKARLALVQLAKTKASSDALQERVRVAQHQAAAVLTRDVGLSLRDAGELLGVTRERARQLASSRER
ncbi:MAG: type II toxin-antitoxin system HicB family antitoxin [Polyangiaceae bacterium]